MTDNLIAATFVVSAALIIAACATVSLFAGLLSAGVLGLAVVVGYIRGGER